MKTCEDCIHVEVCSYVNPYLPVCDSFKDKSRFIELNCSKSLQEVLNNLKPIYHEDIKIALKQMETADDIIGCTIKWLIENSNKEKT